MQYVKQLQSEIRGAIMTLNKGRDHDLKFFLSNSPLFFRVKNEDDYTPFQMLRIKIAYCYFVKLGGANIDKLKALLEDNVENEEDLRRILSQHSFFGPGKTKSEQAFEAVKGEGIELKSLA